MRTHSPRFAIAILLSAVLLGWAWPVTAQDTLLDVRTATDTEVATVRTDSMRLAVPLRLLLGGIVFPDGTVQGTAAEATSGTPDNVAGTLVERDTDGGFAAGPLQVTTDASTNALWVTHGGTTGRAGYFQIDNTGSSSPALGVVTNGDGAGLSVQTSGAGFGVRSFSSGTGPAGLFLIGNAGSDNPALQAQTAGSGHGVYGYTSGTGRAGNFQVSNSSSSAAALAGITNGAGDAIYAHTTGSGSAGRFRIIDLDNDSAAVVVETIGDGEGLFATVGGTGSAVHGHTSGTGPAGFFRITNTESFGSAVRATTSGTGYGLYAYSSGPGDAVRAVNGGSGVGGFFRTDSGNDSPALEVSAGGRGPAVYASSSPYSPVIELDRTTDAGLMLRGTVAGDTRFQIEADGDIWIDGHYGTFSADIAESFAVEGDAADYEPGDVLVISERTDRTMEEATEAYSTRVAGVYATRPGVLLGEHRAAGQTEPEVPVGVVGVIPTKVTVEGGPIRRGDLLVTSSTPGHAMRAEPVTVNGVEIYPTGAVLGKALEPFDGPGAGVIRVLVNVR